MAGERHREGELAIVLHTHMPYVEGFGTWPFGEEWLWEAIATSYLPLCDVLDAHAPAPLTLSLTPVLCDQLEQPGAVQRCLRFLNEIRPESHRRDARELDAAGRGATDLVAELERSAAEYAAAAARLQALATGGGLLAALGAHASWTSAATHPILPLLASDAGVTTQLLTGVASHRRRFGTWGGGLWLPECGYATWLDPFLNEAGVIGTCVELTRVFGLGDSRHLTPCQPSGGPLLWPIDRQVMALVWGRRGYPAAGAYRDYHRYTTHRHRVWRNDGGAYDPAAASAQARADALDFVTRVRRRVANGGVCVCALDTELLGHWWYEGVEWLAGVLAESHRQGLALTRLDDSRHRHAPAPPPADLGVTSWGEGGDLRTWSGPRVADLAWQARSAELRMLAAAPVVPERAWRELLALQSSDWAFLAHRELAGDYPRERVRAHRRAMDGARAGNPGMAAPAVRGLAPDLTGWGG